MDAKTTRAAGNKNKVNASYRLPLCLVKKVRSKANDDNVRPCTVVERLLIEALAKPVRPDGPAAQ